MTIYNVANATQFNSALAKAVSGDTILLAAGNYGDGYLINKNFSSAVTIKSASVTAKAHFDSLVVNGGSNLRFEGLDVGHSLAAGEPEYTQMMRVYNVNGLTLTNMSFHGSIDNNPANDGMGLYINGSSNVQLTGSSFAELFRGAYFENNTNVTVQSNSFKMLRSDGINVGKIDNILIDKNTFSDFHPISWDHPDAIQFWQTNQTTGSSNITITNNVVMPGGGVGTQGIWISDANAIGYKNVLIQNNLLYGNDQYHGISVTGGHGVQILNNTVLSNSLDNKTYWIQAYSGDNFTIRDNVTDMLLIQPYAAGVSLSHNLDLWQTPSARSLFTNLNKPVSVSDLTINGYGYQAPNAASSGSGGSSRPAAPAPAPTVLDADAGSAVSTPSKTTAIAIQPTPAATADLAVADSTIKSALQAAFAPVADHSAPTFSGHAFSAPRTAHLHFDHFVALA